MISEPAVLHRRRQVLGDAGASPDVVAELLAYNASPFQRAAGPVASLPLPDEPHIAAWSDYLEDAGRVGTFAALAGRLVQLRFPVEPGISQTETYRVATRRGVLPAGPPRLALEAPEALSLALHSTLAGRIPILTTGSRRDFVTLVQACSCRNEPDPVPDSMGACIVAGLNNWDRVARLRLRLEAERGAPMTESEWTTAFRAFIPEKALYQDRFIILSAIPYSGVPATDVGLAPAAWLERSLAIRLEHECTHYFTLRAFGDMRNNLLDEFIADFAGLAHAFGRYEARLFLRFMGLDGDAAARGRGRFGLYLGNPPLSAPAADLAAALVVRAAHHLEAFAARRSLQAPGERAALVVALTGLTLEELACEDGPRLLEARLHQEHGRGRAVNESMTSAPSRAS